MDAICSLKIYNYYFAGCFFFLFLLLILNKENFLSDFHQQQLGQAND